MSHFTKLYQARYVDFLLVAHCSGSGELPLTGPDLLMFFVSIRRGESGIMHCTLLFDLYDDN
jgi:hypothetical protein